MKREATVLVALLLVASRAAAGGETIVTDRPGFGESAAVVGSRRAQVEAGLTRTWLGDRATLFDLPQALARIGLGPFLEVRLAAPEWLRGEGPAGETSGWSDTAVGVKGHLAAGANDFSLRATLYLATGSAAWSAGRTEPEAALAWNRALSGRWSLGATVSARRRRLLVSTLLSPSVSLERSLGPRASTFVEYGAGFAEGFRPLHSLDHGYSWLLGPNTQIDASLGVGLSAEAPDFFVGLGFSRRF